MRRRLRQLLGIDRGRRHDRGIRSFHYRGSSGGATTTAAGSAAAGTATVIAADNTTIGQKILENSAGMTVYLFVPDGTSTTSAVPRHQGELAACRRRWHSRCGPRPRRVEAVRRGAARRHAASRLQRPPALHVPQRLCSRRCQGTRPRRRLVRAFPRRRAGRVLTADPYQPFERIWSPSASRDGRPS